MFYQDIINFNSNNNTNNILNSLCVSILKGHFISLKDATFRASIFNIAGFFLKFNYFKLIFSLKPSLFHFFFYFSSWLKHMFNNVVFPFYLSSLVPFGNLHLCFFFRYLKSNFFVFYYNILYSRTIKYFRILLTGSKRNTFCCIYDSNGRMKKLFTVGQDKDFRKSKKRVWLAHSKLADRLYFCIRKFSLTNHFYFFIKLKSLRSQNKVVLKKLLKNLSYYWKSVSRRRKYIHIA